MTSSTRGSHCAQAMAHTTKRFYPLPNVPNSFTEFNAGVILFRQSEPMRQMLAQVAAFYDQQQQPYSAFGRVWQRLRD